MLTWSNKSKLWKWFYLDVNRRRTSFFNSPRVRGTNPEQSWGTTSVCYPPPVSFPSGLVRYQSRFERIFVLMQLQMQFLSNACFPPCRARLCVCDAVQHASAVQKQRQLLVTWCINPVFDARCSLKGNSTQHFWVFMWSLLWCVGEFPFNTNGSRKCHGVGWDNSDVRVCVCV